MKSATKTAKSLALAALLAASLGVAADTATSGADNKSGFSALPGVAAEQLAPTELDKVQGQKFKIKIKIHIPKLPWGIPCPHGWVCG